MKNKLTTRDGADFLNAYSHYSQLVNYFPQLDPKNEEIKKLVSEEVYYNSKLVQNWNNIEIHITGQLWGSTACGWGGMGGAAMSYAYNFIIKQKYTGLLFVYWDGRLAYIMNSSDATDYGNMPSMSRVTALYKGK